MKINLCNCDLFENFKFPIAGWIILIHEVLERFSFYGMKGILTIYLNIYLGFDENVATILYHFFVSLSYLSPIIGAVIADNYLGRYRTVIVIGMIYLLGHILMALTAIRKNIPGPLIGMCILALGAGGIKSSVAAFGGDQIPSGNDKMVEKYFSFFYKAINIGAFVAQFLTPILRKDVSCVDDQCFPLAFGVPAATFLLTYIIFISGRKTYNIVPSSKNVLSKFVHCVYLGISKCMKREKTVKYTNVLDYAQPEYSLDFIDDCKRALKIIIVFIPIPVFWALYDQQGSRWTLQAKYMDGRIGNHYVMKPEQIQSFNSLFIIGLIPVFDLIIYPCCEKVNLLAKPTSRLVASYVVAGLSFILAGLLQIYLVKGQHVDFSVAGSKLVVMNSIPNCNLNLNIDTQHWIIHFKSQRSLDLKPGFHKCLYSCGNNGTREMNVSLSTNQMKSGVVYLNQQTGNLDMNLKTVRIPNEQSYIRFLDTDYDWKNYPITLMRKERNISIGSNYSSVDIGRYNVIVKNSENTIVTSESIEITPGLIGSLLINNKFEVLIIEEFKPKLLHMLWQMPQYILITFAEILCSITALSFAYSESPDSMKSLMQAVYLLTIFGGNLIVVAVAAIGTKMTQTVEFFLFAILVLIAGFINWILIKRFWISSHDASNSQEMTVNK